MIEIDGSFGSGGGAVLRVASALAAVTGQDLKVSSIRKGRPNPGLRAQHLEGLKALASLCSGELEGAALGSEEVVFRPGKIRAGELDIKISTAGSAALVFQTLNLPASQAPGEVVLRISGGATFGKWAPPLLYTKNILLSVLKKAGYDASIDIERHGFYPAGGARAEIRVKPCKSFTPIEMDVQGKLMHMGGLSFASKHLQNAKVAERQARGAQEFLSSRGYKSDIRHFYVDADCPGSGIVLWASTDKGCILGSDGLGERGKPAAQVGKDAALSLVKAIRSRAAVDEFLSDQLLVFMAIAGKGSITAPRLTSHARTNIWVIEQFLPVKFSVAEKEVARITVSQR